MYADAEGIKAWTLFQSKTKQNKTKKQWEVTGEIGGGGGLRGPRVQSLMLETKERANHSQIFCGWP